MKLRINKLGPIQKPSVIDLDKRFTVFVGENGSGKTYLSTALWEWRYEPEWEGTKSDGSWIIQVKEAQTAFMAGVEGWSRRLNKQEEVSFSIPVEEIKQLMREVVSVLVQKTPYKIDEQLAVEVAQWEGTYWDELSVAVHLTFGDQTAYTFTKTPTDQALFVQKEKRSPQPMVQEPNLQYGSEPIKGMTTRSAVEIHRHFESDFPDYQIHEKHLLHSVFQRLFALVFPTAFQEERSVVFLPTSRTTLLSMWKYLVVTDRREQTRLLDRLKGGESPSKAMLQELSPDYSDPTAQWIDLVLQLEDIDEPTGLYTPLIQELESIMNGSIVFKRTLQGMGRKKYYYQRTGTDEFLPLHRAASSVNQLALLYLYLNYLATPRNNTLLIDEPEMNLHPENQVRLVNLLMKFANYGENCVYITTHSPLIANMINNHILIGYLQEKGEEEKTGLEKVLQEHQLNINENLSYKDFAVYHFADGGFEEYKAGEYGVAFKDFNKAREEINNITRSLIDEVIDYQDRRDA